MTYFSLPIEIRSMIMEMAGIDLTKYWMQRYSNDVLPLINKGYRLVGFECEYHGNTLCECNPNKMNPCANCYCYGFDACNHSYWDFISFEKIHQYSSILRKYPYIPKETFLYIYDHNANSPLTFYQIYYELGNRNYRSRSETFLMIRNGLKQIPSKRIDYIKRNIHLWDNSFDLIDECFYLGQLIC